MECSQAQERLSAYFDGELSSDERATLAEHVAACAACSEELARFQRLSGMARELESPAVPAHVWPQLEEQLGKVLDDERVQPSRRPPSRSHSMQRIVAIAATILVTFGLGWWGYSTWSGPGEQAVFAAELGHYLDEFSRDPAQAQQFLLTKYQGQAVDARQAVRQVGYRPAVADGLPEGYSIEATYVMEMPCCTCVQCICQRRDGTTVVIFEHNDEATGHASNAASCDGTPCSLVEIDDRIAANWQRGEQHFTVVGLRDATELADLVAWFDERRQMGPP